VTREAAGGRSRATIVLLHGASSNQADLVAALAPHFPHDRLIAPDRPGHGWSDRLGGREMADPARQAEALMRALDTVAPEPFVLIAHSLAGAAATRIALERPERLKGLVLLGGVTHPWPGGISWYYTVSDIPVIGPLFARLVGIPGAALLLERGAAGVFAPKPMTPGYLERSAIRLMLRPGPFVANGEDVAATLAFVTAQAPRYRTLKVPVVAITGDSDSVVSPTIHSTTIAREAPDGRFVLLPGVGHMPHHAAPEIVAEAVEAMVGPPSRLAGSR